MGNSLTGALELCRSLLAYSAPGAPVSVPHAALAELVDLASGTTIVSDPSLPAGLPAVEPLQGLHDVAALGRRYNRARPTVREWFREGLFGPPEERRFRGKEYVATDDAVREFERATGLRPADGHPQLLPVDDQAVPLQPLNAEAALRPPVASPETKGRGVERRSSRAQKILAAQSGSGRRRGVHVRA